MAKYSLEFKMKLINEYKSGRKSITSVAKSNNIDRSMLRKWIRHFEGKGVDSLKNQDQIKYMIKILNLWLLKNI
ncbi:transposase [Mycoplasma sp. P36-A1]|uniref:transposase n=1 Tax=Mycoplasma sp. P36-A1 TaxID=3252900 RepID=UPI003C2C499B